MYEPSGSRNAVAHELLSNRVVIPPAKWLMPWLPAMVIGCATYLNSTAVVVVEVVVVSSTVVGIKVVAIEAGNVVDEATDVDDEVDVVVMAVLVSFPPSERVKINPTISMTTKALAPMTTS
jgi:hypothetical protein